MSTTTETKTTLSNSILVQQDSYITTSETSCTINSMAPKTLSTPKDRNAIITTTFETSCSTNSMAPKTLSTPKDRNAICIYGPMTSGKTTKLLQMIRQYEGLGKKVLCINHSLDVRYATSAVSSSPLDPNGYIVSHDSERVPAVMVNKLTPLLKHLSNRDDIHVVVVDEIHMFDVTDLREFMRGLKKMNRIRIGAGLDTDWQRLPFAWMTHAYEMFDSTVILKAKCSTSDCVSPALFTIRLTTEVDQLVVGGVDKYRATCEAHHTHVVSTTKTGIVSVKK